MVTMKVGAHDDHKDIGGGGNHDNRMVTVTITCVNCDNTGQLTLT